MFRQEVAVPGPGGELWTDSEFVLEAEPTEPS